MNASHSSSSPGNGLNRRQGLAPFVFLLLALLLAFPHPGRAFTEAPCVSVRDIEISLPQKPIVAGFDVDDTLLFCSPAFHYGAANKEGPDGANVYGPEPYKNQSFWDDLNSRLVKFCLPLENGRKLIEMHKRRGDAIVFVTARRGSPNETLTAQLAELYGLKDVKPVVFTDGGSKSQALREFGASIYYGDSDGDAQSALDAGVRPIRMPRAAISTAPDAIHPGAFGESRLCGPCMNGIQDGLSQ